MIHLLLEKAMVRLEWKEANITLLFKQNVVKQGSEFNIGDL